MTLEDIYLHAVINRRRPTGWPHQPLAQIQNHLRAWSLHRYLESVTISGSYPKGTALRGSDLDIFLSLSPETPCPLSELRASLADHFHANVPTPRNVALGIQFEGHSLDIVPARRRPNSTHHTLWQNRYDTWLQTDIAEQIRHIGASGLTTEILALKLWRNRQHLRFPSFLLELTTLRALTPNCSISDQFRDLLTYLATTFSTARLTDPANSNNIVSATLLTHEKQAITAAAAQSLQRGEWALT